jgi:hypothetical protein
MNHWAAQYIGLLWEAGAQGPDAYDCWSFFRMVQKKHFNLEVPLILAADYDDPTLLVNLFREHEENQRWGTPKPYFPVHGDAVIIHKPLHVGTWLEVDGGGVLHCMRGSGVVFTHEAAWRLSGFGRREYRRFGC